MPKPSSCPRCQGSMAQGFVLDHGDYGQRAVTSWVEGEPQKSFWLGVNTKDRQAFEIQTFRCNRCGYLESYAPG